MPGQEGMIFKPWVSVIGFHTSPKEKEYKGTNAENTGNRITCGNLKSPLKSLFRMRLNKHLFNRVNNKERKRGERSVVWLKRGQPCLHRLHVLSTVFSWRPFSSFSLWIILLPPSLPPLILPLLISVMGALVPLAWGLMAGGRGFASHGGVTLSRRWPCHRWKPLDIPGTHLYSVMQLLTKCSAIYRDN